MFMVNSLRLFAVPALICAAPCCAAEFSSLPLSQQTEASLLSTAAAAVKDGAWQEWTEWLAQFAGPGALGSWDNAFQSEAGLARRHNVTAFLSAIYVNAQASGADALKSLAADAMEALKKLP